MKGEKVLHRKGMKSRKVRPNSQRAQSSRPFKPFLCTNLPILPVPYCDGAPGLYRFTVSASMSRAVNLTFFICPRANISA
jgi:hypothetical protein